VRSAVGLRPAHGDEDLERYRLLACAIAGRGLKVARARSGEPSHTDGRTIFLAREGDDLGALAVQGALLAAGSLAPELMRALLGRPRRARRYLALEGGRALRAMAASLPRLDVVAAAASLPTLSASAEQSLAIAQGRGRVPAPPAAFGALRPRRVIAAAAPALGAEPPPSAGEPGGEDPPEEEGEQAASAPDAEPALQRPSRLARWFSRAQEDERDAQPETGGVFIAAGQALRAAGPTVPGSLSLASLLPTEIESADRRGWCYPEWDVRAGTYLPGWCSVFELDPPGRAGAPLERPLADGLERRLARLGVGLERRRRERQGDDIDIDAVVQARVDLLSGSPPSEGLYVDSQRRRRSLAVLLLVDVSGSAGERGALQRTVHAHQRDAAAMLLEALYVLGDRVAVYGFCSHGRTAVELLRVKAFEEVLDGAVYDRLGRLEPGGYSRLGAAIRHGAHVLDTHAGTERRVLVVLSDGFAYDDGYEGSYGEADASRALGEARRAGVGCLCLSLGATSEAEALTRVFGTAAHASAAAFDELLPGIGMLFRSALASADLVRRLAQRDRRGDGNDQDGAQ
jgi:Mg-chelatase subunit ChlD